MALTITASTTYQIIDGFGASDAWEAAMDDTWADFFFITLGLSLLRQTIPPTGTPTVAAISNAVKAKARGARVWATPWSPPGEWKSNGTTNNGGTLNVEHYQDWANRLADFADAMVSGGAPLYAMGLQNEPDYTATWDSCRYNASQICAFLKVLGQTMTTRHPLTKLLLPETGAWDYLADLMTSTWLDSVASPYVGIVGTHEYEPGAPYLYTEASSRGIPLWETEYSTFDAFQASISNALTVSRTIHNNLANANAAAYHYWWLFGGNNDNEGLIGYNDGTQHFTLTKRAYCLGQYARFVRPGYRRVDASGTPAGTYATAFKSLQGSIVVVVINNNPSTTALDVNVVGALLEPRITPWVTDETRDLSAQPDVVTTGSSFSYTLPAFSVTTFASATGVNPVVLAGAFTYEVSTVPLPVTILARPGALVEVEVDSVVVSTATATESGIASAEIEVGLGEHNIRARQTLLGLTSTWSSYVHVTGIAPP